MVAIPPHLCRRLAEVLKYLEIRCSALETAWVCANNEVQCECDIESVDGVAGTSEPHELDTSTQEEGVCFCGYHVCCLRSHGGTGKVDDVVCGFALPFPDKPRAKSHKPPKRTRMFPVP